MREQFYSNQFVQGTVLRPLWRALGLSIGIVLLTGLGGEIAVLLLVWLLPGYVQFAFRVGPLVVGLLGLWGLVACWAQFVTIMRSRSYVAAGLPLACAEGPAVFSGGRKAHRGSYPPKVLEIGGQFFDITMCADRRQLTTVGNYPFVHAEDHPRGRTVGMKVATPFRVWYTPSRVVIRAEIEVPEAYLDPERRTQFLLREFPERAEQIKRMEAARQRVQASGPPSAEVQAKIDRLQAMIGKMGTRQPRR